MADNQILIDKLKKLEEGLFFLSEDCKRMLSNHERIDLVNELRTLTAGLIKEAEDS